MQVHCNEGVANHIDPESCAGGREAGREALTGEHAGRPLSRENSDLSGADAVPFAEGNTEGCDNASTRSTRRGQRPWHACDTLCTRTGRPRDWPGRLIATGPHRKGEEP